MSGANPDPNNPDRPDPLATAPSRISKAQKVALGVLGACSLVAVIFVQANRRGTEPPRTSGETTIASNVRFDAFRPPSTPPEPTRESMPQIFAAQSERPGQAHGQQAARPQRMVSYAVPQQLPRPPQAATDAAPSAGQGPSAPGQPGATSVQFKGTTLPGGRAGAAMDTSLMLMPGVYGCVLDTAVSSERAGPFQCHTKHDIKSPFGATLMEAGTVIIGSYQSDVGQGQARVVSLVATAYTKNGVPVPMGNAPVADALGRVGMPGAVNRHLAERFGGAVLLLLSQGAISTAQNAVRSGNGNTYLNLESGSGVSSVATEALRSSINIPNTVEKNQGEEIGFFITAPISFEDAYRLRPR